MKALSMEQNDKYFNKTKQALLELEDVLEDLKIVAKGAVNKNNELSLRVSRLNNEIEQKISDIETIKDNDEDDTNKFDRDRIRDIITNGVNDN